MPLGFPYLCSRFQRKAFCELIIEVPGFAPHTDEIDSKKSLKKQLQNWN